MSEFIDFTEETKELMAVAIERLPKLDREVVMAVFYDGESRASVARRLGVSDRTVGRALRRSYAKLRPLALAAQGEPDDA